MIDFPSSPSNGQVASLAGNTYTYNSNKSQWQVSTVPTYPNAIPINRTSNTTSGISWYSTGYTAWSEYMASAGTNGNGPTGNITAPAGALVTAWGLRSFIENPTGYGWTFESGSGSGQPTVVAEIRSSDGTFHTYGAIYANSSITAMYSDRRLKTDVIPITNALDKVDKLSGMTFLQNDLAKSFGYTDYSRQAGVFAQDVQVVQPEAVKIAPFDMDAEGNSKSGESYLTVQYEKLVPLLIEAIKELRLEVEALKGK